MAKALMAHPDSFRFRQFSVAQSDNVFKVGTDGVLLGAWLDLSEAENAVDLGVGTGLISLIAAQRFSGVRITGIDMNNEAISLASLNYDRSDWASRLSAVKADLSRPGWPVKRAVDHIFSNPPFFQKDMVASSRINRKSKHAEGISLKHLIFHAKNYLTPQGRLSLIYPYALLDDLTDFANSQGFRITRLMRIRSKPEKPWYRFMIELSNLQEDNTKQIEDELTLYDNVGQRRMTEKFRSMVKDLYINI